ncbi:hypothetical protein M427DRAFT_50226 [Gonapodya prolifera JEL478]|uniref:Nudix hydrolase domain-containing protein n=1 Tax=Gonapodya prolifera (strain JEL478) TaxID=1344416 RepID=A0A138ZWP9_GONPJ|nr:hypothetical protein M427DRAFT_50226 [Gonapodya prolifera JEL478]|eukprot:KXS08901.1 hypothetical protein M427DRAFT_50226 [Gonapodya prolifera JEL478]
MAYVELVRGKYSSNPVLKEHLLKTFASELTVSERGKLLENYQKSKNKFEQINLKELFDSVSSEWIEPEYGIPKGRRMLHETELQCAIREFFEETGYKRTSYTFIDSIDPIVEEYVATNGFSYRHVYFLAVHKDPRDVALVPLRPCAGEISLAIWVPITKCKEFFRSYDKEKMEVVDKLANDILPRIWDEISEVDPVYNEALPEPL